MTSTDDQTSGDAPFTPNLKPWKKGQSGNPRGRRPKGLATVERLRTALIKDLPEIIRTVVDKAKAGDQQAARTILERVLPALKPIEPPVYLGDVAGTLTEQSHAILNAMATGLIAPGAASQLIGAIAATAKVIEMDDLARRIAELEKSNAQKPK